jgi:hypothetical protein
VDLVIPDRGVGARHLGDDEDVLEKTFRGESAKATPLLVDQELGIRIV